MLLVSAEEHAAQQDTLRRLLTLQEGSMRVQIKREAEQAERDAKAASKAETDKAEAARLARQESSANVLKMIKNTASKAQLGWLVTLSAIEDPSDRALLVHSVIEATQMMEDAAEDREEANAVIEAATKKTTLPKEKQEDLLKVIKIKKRAAMASSAGAAAHCGRCDRTNHTTADCVARTHASGGSCSGEPSVGAVAKYQRTKSLLDLRDRERVILELHSFHHRCHQLHISRRSRSTEHTAQSEERAEGAEHRDTMRGTARNCNGARSQEEQP
jgi:hypothetical protein